MRAHRSALTLASALAEAERLGLAQRLSWPDLPSLAQAVWGYSRAKTRTLVEIHRVFVERLGFALDELGELHWTKLAALLPLASGRAEAAAWLERARVTPLRVLRAEVRAHRTGLPPDRRVAKTFLVPAEAERVVELALDAVGREAGTDDRGRQLELLAADALAGRLGSPTVTIRLSEAGHATVAAAMAATAAADPGEALLRLAEHYLECPAPVHLRQSSI